MKDIIQKFPKDYFMDITKNLLAIDSPTGFTGAVIEKISEYIADLGYPAELTTKGNLIVSLAGEDAGKTVGLSAHVDTLGLVVRGFKSDGTLSFSRVGGPVIPTLDGEYCKIYTRCGKVYTGTILSNSPSGHVYSDASKLERNEENMHIRIDEIVKNADEAKALGILPGDFICYEPKTVFTPSGFIKSRFLDDKLSVAIMLSLLKSLKENGAKPRFNTKIIFTTFEEVGHGLSHMPAGISEVVAVDMGCIGSDLSCTEFDVSICAKDSSGPYNYELTSHLINLAKNANLKFAVDIYPNYGSDASAALRAGHDIKAALIGPGVAASHGMERSHMSASENVFALLWLYLV